MGLLIGLIAIVLLTIAIQGVIFMAAFRRFWTGGVSINIPPIQIVIPDKLQLNLQYKQVPARVEVNPPDDPIPEDILDYISQESELHAQQARMRRVRELRIEAGSWDAAFRLLQREDNSLGL